METYRILQNERLLPGITKVLMAAQDFPQIAHPPHDLLKMRRHQANVMNQIGQVFVYEETFDAVNCEKNGTLSLLKKLPEGSPVSAQDLH